MTNDNATPMTRKTVVRKLGLAALLAPVALVTACAPQPAPVVVQAPPPAPAPAPAPTPVPRRRARG